MTRQEAIERIGGKKRAATILGLGCLIPLVLIVGLVVSGVGWLGGQVRRAAAAPSWAIYEPYQSWQAAADGCGDGEVMALWRGGYGCVIDRDATPFVARERGK